MDSNSNLLAEWTWSTSQDYSVQKAHAITPVDGTDNSVLTAGHNHPDGPCLYIAQLELDKSSLPPVFTPEYTNEIEFTAEWKIPHVSDLGYLDEWYWGGPRNFNSYIVTGSDPDYTPAGQLSGGNKAFCIAVNLDNIDEDWLSLEEPHYDEFAQWARLVVAGSDIYCAGTYDSDRNGIFDSILMGMPDLFYSSIESDIETFRSPSFSFSWVRIAYCDHDETASDFIMTVAKGIDVSDQSERIAIVTWNSNGISVDTEIKEFNGYDNLQPFTLRYYPDDNAAILLLSYRNIHAVQNTNCIAAYRIPLSATGDIGTIVQLGSNYLVPYQSVQTESGLNVQLNAIVPKDFNFTDDGSDINEFEGYGCGIMRNNYSGIDPHHYKHNWLFKFEHTDINSSTDISFEGSAIRTHCPSYNGIQFYSIPEEYGERLDISVFDLSGRQIVQYSNRSVVDLMSAGIRGVQQGVYFVNIRCTGQNEYHTVKCIVLD